MWKLHFVEQNRPPDMQFLLLSSFRSFRLVLHFNSWHQICLRKLHSVRVLITFLRKRFKNLCVLKEEDPLNCFAEFDDVKIQIKQSALAFLLMQR